MDQLQDKRGGSRTVRNLFKADRSRLFCFYLLHNLGESRTEFFDRFDLWNWLQEKKQEGLIKHLGFSFHSTPEELEAILTAHPEMEFVQLQINYADWENPAIQSRACYEEARKHGKPVIIMEPVKGGMLATPPESVAKILKNAEPGFFRCILGNPLCCKSGRRYHRTFWHEQHRTDAG